MKILSIILTLILDIVPKGPAFLEQLQKRDSILVADQLEYGFVLDSIAPGTMLGLSDFESISNDTLTVVRSWKLDTLRTHKRGNFVDVRGSVVLAPFEEGKYVLPPIYVARNVGGKLDTLMYEAPELEVKTIPIDTASFVLHDIKAQIRYPVTFKETLPWIAGGLVLAGLVVLAVWFFRKRRREMEEELRKDPPHIVALRCLEKYRGNKFWAPDKQKGFYSGVTDTLKEYIDSRFGVDAPEMTTAELFAALKGSKDITPDLFGETKELFETADFVKFAKFTAPDDYNAKVLPLAVRFVTDTYRSGLEEEPEGDVL